MRSFLKAVLISAVIVGSGSAALGQSRGITSDFRPYITYVANSCLGSDCRMQMANLVADARAQGINVEDVLRAVVRQVTSTTLISRNPEVIVNTAATALRFTRDPDLRQSFNDIIAAASSTRQNNVATAAAPGVGVDGDDPANDAGLNNADTGPGSEDAVPLVDSIVPQVAASPS